MNDKFFDLKQEKQDRMINAGLKGFARNGYAHAATDDMVREAAVSKGLLFHYFGSKAGLYAFLVDYGVRFLLLELERKVDGKERDFFGIARQMEDALLVVLKNYPYLYAFLEKASAELSGGSTEEAGRLRACRERMEAYYDQAEIRGLREDVSLGRIKTMFRHMKRGIMEENLALETMQPEMLHVQICTGLRVLEGLCRQSAATRADEGVRG